MTSIDEKVYKQVATNKSPEQDFYEKISALKEEHAGTHSLNSFAGYFIKKFTNPNILEFRPYVAKMLSALGRISQSDQIQYWGYVPERRVDGEIEKPSMVLKAEMRKESMLERKARWASGEISTEEEPIQAMREFAQERRIVTTGTRLLAPIYIQTEKIYRPHGMILLNRKDGFAKGDLELTDYLLQEIFMPQLAIFGVMRRDAMTGFYNQMQKEDLLISELKKARENNYPLSIIFADIDKFKRINDNYGHLEGDKIIMTVAEIIRESVRQYDRLIRLGGEEFGILAADAEMELAYKIAERVRSKIETHRFESSSYKTPSHKVTMSLGIVSIDGKDILKDDLLKNQAMALYNRGDHRLYLAKGLGRNRVKTDKREETLCGRAKEAYLTFAEKTILR